jgi:hypothetical protein
MSTINSYTVNFAKVGSDLKLSSIDKSDVVVEGVGPSLGTIDESGNVTNIVDIDQVKEAVAALTPVADPVADPAAANNVVNGVNGVNNDNGDKGAPGDVGQGDGEGEGVVEGDNQYVAPVAEAARLKAAEDGIPNNGGARKSKKV